MRILGHRGARLVAPENTVAAYRAALAEGADGVELDVRLTADRALVCLHDATLGRTTSGRGRVRERTLAEVRALDAGALFAANGSFPYRGRGLRVPTLTEALDAVPPPALVDIEVKAPPNHRGELGALVEALAAALDGRQDRDRLRVTSFSRKLVALAVRALPDLRVGLVTSAIVPLGMALSASERLGCSVLAAQSPTFFAPKASVAVARAQAAGIELVAWTVDEAAVARRLADLGVDAVVTDRPGALRRELAALPG